MGHECDTHNRVVVLIINQHYYFYYGTWRILCLWRSEGEGILIIEQHYVTNNRPALLFLLWNVEDLVSVEE